MFGRRRTTLYNTVQSYSNGEHKHNYFSILKDLFIIGFRIFIMDTIVADFRVEFRNRI